MNSALIKKTWPLLKKIFSVVFVIHFGWFLYFIWTEFSDSDFLVGQLRLKMLVATGIVGLLVLIYHKWLRHIAITRRIVGFFRELFFIFYISCFLYLLWGMTFNPPLTITQVGSIVQGDGLKRDQVGFNRMSPWIKLAVIASEDQNFADHDGFDLDAIERAVKFNKKHVKRKHGASTISQQVAKNIFLWQGGGLLRKGIEMFFTFSIEKLWSKRTILERYLNCIETGRGIYGVQAASRAYFNKDAKDLTRAEAAQIAACLPNPKRFTVRPMSNWVAGRYEDIMVQMGYLEGDEGVGRIIK